MPKLYSFADFYISSPSILVERVGNSCFVYVPLPSDPLEDMRDQILGQVDVEVDKIYDPDKFHITLLYIEDCGLSEISELVSQFMPPIQFNVELASLEIFDEGEVPVLVWRIDPGPALLRLQSDLYFRAENQNLPISPFSKPEVYKPHVTVAYLKGVPRDVPSITPFKIAVDKFKVGRDDYNVLFTVHLPTGRGERFFIEAHPESNGHTEITQSELKSILSGERIVYGPQRRIIGLNDGPFSLRHGKHSGQEGREGEQGGSQEGFTHVGAEDGKNDGLPEAEIRQDMEAIRKEKNEIGFYYTENGERIGPFGGNRTNGIAVTDEIENELDQLEENGIDVALLHNHPSGSPFSEEDILFAVQHGIEEMRISHPWGKLPDWVMRVKTEAITEADFTNTVLPFYVEQQNDAYSEIFIELKPSERDLPNIMKAQRQSTRRAWTEVAEVWPEWFKFEELERDSSS